MSLEMSLATLDSIEKHALNLQDVVKHESEITKMRESVLQNIEFKSA